MTEEKKQMLQKPLDKMTVTELREVAKEIPDITGAHGMKKAELLAAIKEAKGIVDDVPKQATGEKTSSSALTVKEMKALIQGLKAKRHQALEQKDKQLAARYRRMISRLKKKTRRAA